MDAIGVCCLMKLMFDDAIEYGADQVTLYFILQCCVEAMALSLILHLSYFMAVFNEGIYEALEI
jgi:hypothetical protein